MKYLYLVLVLALGYEGYVNWAEIQAKYAEISGRVATANTTAKAQAAAAPAPLPGQPAPAAASAAPAPAALSVRVAESQKLAIAKYPALSVANSEMNSRFVFRYKRMLTEKSPRLQDPTWPMQLADEVAVAAGVKPKATGTAPAAPLVAHQTAAH